MGLLGRIVSAFRKDKPSDKPPIYGGDGLSDESPAIVNCASMGMAQSLIDRFISDKCGEEWERGIEMTLASRNDPEKNIKMISVNLPDGTENRFYFDLSRPVAVAMKMGGMRQRQPQPKSYDKPESGHQTSRQTPESSLPCEIHENDKDLVTDADLAWWHSLKVKDVMEMEQTDNVFKLAAFKKFCEQGLDSHESAKKVRLAFLTYYGRTKDRKDPRFNFPEEDVSLPYVLKKRIDDGISSGRVTKQELQSGTSINAVIRKKIRSGGL